MELFATLSTMGWISIAGLTIVAVLVFFIFLKKRK
jgi:LPXTG-motif cell wall-anchored protein